MNSFNYTCQGESHIREDKVCQDYSFSMTNNKYAIAIVSDGHGGAPYFRSDIGARFLVDITKESVDFFVNNFDYNTFLGIELYQHGVNDNDEKDIDRIFRHFFRSIWIKWQEKIKEHAENTPLSEKEKEKVEQKYQERFNKNENFEKFYGCTLIVYVQTEYYWFGFQIGDGKFMSFHNETQYWKFPIPWDDKCFLNKTTSICDSNALNEFRFCYQSNGFFPTAVFMGSDGIDDSFGEDKNLANFYSKILKSLILEGYDETCNSIKNDLPIISKQGSQDDMSIAFVVNDEYAKRLVGNIINKQINDTNINLINLNYELEQLLSEKVMLDSKLEKSEEENEYCIEKLTELEKETLLKESEINQQLKRIDEKKENQGMISFSVEKCVNIVGLEKTEISIIEEETKNLECSLLKLKKLQNEYSLKIGEYKKTITNLNDSIKKNENNTNNIKREIENTTKRFAIFQKELEQLNLINE